MIHTSRPEDVFLSSGRWLLSRAVEHLDDPSDLVGYLWKALGFFADLDVLVVSRKAGGKQQLFVCQKPSVVEADFDYFLRFCKQDILLNDRFADLDNLDLIQSSGPTDGATGDEGNLRSYTCFPLFDPEGPVGLLHVASRRNHYFNATVVDRLTALLPFFGSLLARSFQQSDLRERKTGLLNLFAKFLPESVIQRLLDEQRRSQGSMARKTQVVILFSDIRSFTAITEQNGAEAVVKFLNRHFQAMVAEIAAQGGVIDKFIGDAIVAVFDADQNPSDACNRAVRAARNMLAQLPHVDVSSVVLAQGRYGIGVGLHRGDAVAGSIGSTEKMAYTPRNWRPRPSTTGWGCS